MTFVIVSVMEAIFSGVTIQRFTQRMSYSFQTHYKNITQNVLIAKNNYNAY